MNNRPAGWRMPTPKQMEKLAASIGRKTVVTPPLGPQDEMPDEYWHAVLNDAQVDTRSSERSSPGQCLSDIPQHVLRVTHCRDPEGRRHPAVRKAGQLEGGRAATARQHLPEPDWPP